MHRRAGLWQGGIPGQITGQDIGFQVDTNLKATIFTNQSAYGLMRKGGGGGRIINFGSGEAVMGSPVSAVYAATKGAVAGMDSFDRQGVFGDQFPKPLHQILVGGVEAVRRKQVVQFFGAQTVVAVIPRLLDEIAHEPRNAEWGT
jgi:hypothetical protein